MLHRLLQGRLCALVVLFVAAFAAPASAAPITLQTAGAFPITAASQCTVEPKQDIYDNTDFDPAQSNEWFGSPNVPSIDDVQRDLRAGANSDFCIGYTLPPDYNFSPRNQWAVPGTTPKDPNTHAATGDDQKDITIDLPLGFSGNLANFDTCSEADFGIDGTLGGNLATCPVSSIVGEATVRLSTTAFNLHILLGGVFQYDPPGPYPGAIHRLPSGPDEVGRLGVQIYPDLGATKPSKFVVRLVLAPDGSGRIRAIVQDAPRTNITAGLRDLYIESVFMRMFGSAAEHPALAYQDRDGWDVTKPALHGDFAETPTDCSTGASAHVKVTTYGGPRSAAPEDLAPVTSQLDTPPFTVTDCESLPFRPAVTVSTTERAPATPTGVKVQLSLGQQKSGDRLPALLKDAQITLPAGLELGAQAGTDGLPLCTAAQFNAASALTPSDCPAATQAADLTITSPLIETPFAGKAYLGEQQAVGELPDLYLEAALPGATAPDAPRVKLVGKVTADEDGRITTTFKDNPQLRFSKLELDFPGGPSALFSTPDRCGTHVATSQLRSYAHAASFPVDASVVIDQDCETPAFAPAVSVVPHDTQAGSSSDTSITIERADRSPWIDDVHVALPSGMLADLNVVAECPAASALVGACDQSSRIATVRTWAGAGASPLPLTGQMFLTERQPGAVAGAVIVVRAQIGELDLGDVIVPGRINLRPDDAGLDFIADLPTRFRGLALQLQKVVVTLDRPGFALNPSACGPLVYGATITGAGGQIASPSGAASYTGCDALPFQPQLRAHLTGDVKPLGFPGMWVELTARAGDTNLRTANVVLPDGVAAALENVQNPCVRAAFDAGTCPASTRIGSAVANVSITPDPIPGDVFLVRVPGEVLPGLGLNFTGRFAQRVISRVKTNAQGRLVTVFDGIPDLPLRRLTLDIAGGPKGPLRLAPGECAANTRWDGTFSGQGGQVAGDQIGLRCAALAKVSLGERSGLSLRIFDFGGRNLKSAKVILPAGWSFDPKLARKNSRSWARATGSRTRRAFTRRSLTVAATGARATTLRLKVKGSAVSKRGKRGKKARTVSLTVRYVFTDGAVQTQTLNVKAR